MKTNEIYNVDCIEGMKQLEDDSIALTVTSPPYYNLKEYSHWDNYESYLSFLRDLFNQLFRITRPSGWVAWNTQKYIPFPKSVTGKERKHTPLTAEVTLMLCDSGFNYENRIVWYKGKGTATQKMFGSYPYPPTIMLSNITEDIILVRKPLGKYNLNRTEKENSIITKKEWGEWAVDIWEFQPERASKIGHPAPFPIELPYRCIKLFTFQNDVILDPFMGSGTTAVVCKQTRRNYIGFEINPEYIKMANERLKSINMISDWL